MAAAGARRVGVTGLFNGRRENRYRSLPINFAPVAKRDEGYFVLCDVEAVNDPVVANAEPELGPSGHSVMRKGVETASHIVDFSHD